MTYVSNVKIQNAKNLITTVAAICNASDGQKWISQGHVSQPCPFFVPISQEVKGADQSTRFICPATTQTFQRVHSKYRWPSFFVDFVFEVLQEVKVKH